MDKFYYIASADNVMEILSNGIQLNNFLVVAEEDLSNKINKFALTYPILAIFEITDPMVDKDEIDKNSFVRPEFLKLSDPKSIGASNKLNSRFYELFIKAYSSAERTIQKSICSLIKSGNNDLAETLLYSINPNADINGFIETYSNGLKEAEREQIKNAENAAWMTAMKKCG